MTTSISLPCALLALLLSVQSAGAVEVILAGNSADASTTTSPLICLAGGGNSDKWAGGWRAFLEASGGGDIVVIRTDDSGPKYDSWIYKDSGKHGFPNVNSVKIITIENADDANHPEVVKMIMGAEAIFFAGGRQSSYIDLFRGSKMMAAVEHVMNVKHVPIAGTSAGMALLAGIDYSGRFHTPAQAHGNVTSNDVLRDPTGKFVDLDRTVLVPPFMKDVVTESHFSQRKRQGRLVGFMARAVFNQYEGVSATSVKGIGADEATAVCYDGAGMARVYGAGDVYFLKGAAPIERIAAGAPLHWMAQQDAVQVYVLKGSNSAARFNLATWTGEGGVAQRWWVDGADPSAPALGVK